ncbi:MAG TPA: SdrD B-like domain-containing protein [Gemmataceae bacterium]|nr:SdrD B-like domain-containing protein [Gemmataceae bacterium]
MSRRPAARLHVEPLEAREVPASLAGRVFLDFDNSGAANGPDSGLWGVTVTLSGGGLTTPLTQTTDAQGNFSFTGLAAGTYTLTETQPTAPANQSGKTTAGTAGGSTTTLNTVSGIVLAASTAATGYTFAEVPLVSTGGFVYQDTNGNGKKDAGEPGIAGVTVTLTGSAAGSDTAITPKTAVTGDDGSYTFTGLVPGKYTLTETQPNGFIDGKEENGTPTGATVSDDKFTSIDLTKSSAASGGFNFGEVKAGSISGVVFNDANNDGTQAATGEPGIAGVKVRLTGADVDGHAVTKTTTTAADGSYTFGNLLPGTYAVQEVQPAGYADGKEKAGTAEGTTTTNDRITDIHLASGAAATGYTFGEQARADLVLRQSPGSMTINPGGTVTVTFTLKNKGAAAATASKVVVNFGGLTFISTSTPAAFNATTKTWTVGDLAPGATQTIRFTFRAAVAGTFAPSGHATTTATEITDRNNRSSATVMAGVVPPPAPSTSPMASMFANLLALISQKNLLSRIWLFSKLFG